MCQLIIFILTYGPAKAAPANRNGDAATAAIVDLIDMIVLIVSHGHKKTLADDRLPDMGIFLHLHRGTIFSSPLYEVMY